MPKGKPGLTDLCSTCKQVKDRKGRYCTKCHAAYMRKWRKNHEFSLEQKLKGIVRSKTKMRIRRGLLIKYPCEICGDKDVQAHHQDYNKPYDITWLCKYHHQEHHRNMPRKKRKKHMLSFPTEIRKKLISLIFSHEGFRQFPYKDTRGNWTIGIGRNLSTKGISEDEALYLLDNDIMTCESLLWKNILFYASLDDIRKCVLIEMCFNMGINALLEFKNMLAYIKNKDFSMAAKAMLDSEWARQVKGRASKLALIMETGVE